MARGRRTIWLAAAPLLLLTACGGGGGGGGPDCSSAPSLTGTWTGALTDDQAGGGSLGVSFTQAGCALGGSWQADFAGTAFDGSGSVSGTQQGDGASITFLTTVPGSCGYRADGTFDGDNEISGTYATVGTSCARSGSFDLLRAVTPTPVPTATSSPTATATPTPTPTP